MNIDKLMTKAPVCCAPGDTLNAAAQLMWDHDCGCIPVVEGSEECAAGVITDRDICMAALHTGKALRDIRVQDVMARDLCACAPSDSVEKAEELMRSAQVRRLPVLDDGRLVGILSLADI